MSLFEIKCLECAPKKKKEIQKSVSCELVVLASLVHAFSHECYLSKAQPFLLLC